MPKRDYGRTRSGKPITEELLDELAKNPRRASTLTRSSADEGAAHPWGQQLRPWKAYGWTLS